MPLPLKGSALDQYAALVPPDGEWLDALMADVLDTDELVADTDDFERLPDFDDLNQ